MLSKRQGVVVALSIAAAMGTLALRSRHPSRPTGMTSPARALSVEISGCSAIVRGPACETSPGSELHLFIPAREASAVVVTIDGERMPETRAEAPDGHALRVVVPPSSRQIRVTSLPAEQGRTWAMALVTAGPAAEGLAKARALKAAGKFDEAAASLGTTAPADAHEHAAQVSLSARIEYARGDTALATAQFREAVGLHAEEGRPSDAVEDAFALIHLLLESGRYGEVRPLLAQAATLSADFPKGRALVTYYLAMLAHRTGDLRLALRLSREAVKHADQLGETRLRRMAQENIARELHDVGRSREAFRELQALLASDGAEMAPCDRALLEGDVGWSAAQLETDGEHADIDTREPFRRALELLRSSCPEPNRIANAYEGLAFAALARGRLEDARAALVAAKAAGRDPGVPMVLFWEHLAVELAQKGGEFERALAASAREAAVATAFGSADDQRQASEDRATALVGLSRKREALAVLEAADTLLAAGGATMPLGEGKATFFGTRDRGTALRVELLVEFGRGEEAMQVARQGRARVVTAMRGRAALASLDDAARRRWEEAFERYSRARESIDEDAAHDWELSEGRLAAAIARREQSSKLARAALDDAVAVLSKTSSPPGDVSPVVPRKLGEGEVELLYFPTDHEWLGFVRDTLGTRVVRLGAVDPHATKDVLARELIEPFRAAVDGASRIRLLPYGAARALDLHALPFHGAPLLAHAVVVYALDLTEAVPGEPVGNSALVVGDPNGNLPNARREAETVAARLSEAGRFAPTLLKGREAEGEAVRAALGAAVVFHYAGHALFAGLDGVESVLPLASGGALTPEDILALPRVPRFVALFGCETGRESVDGRTDTFGLANAFLSAGTQTVIATSRAVDDGLARDIAGAFYARLASSSERDAGRAFRDAILAVAEARLEADWSAFRVLVR